MSSSHWTESKGRGAWTPEEYLSFYYSKAERTEWNKEPGGQELNKAVNESFLKIAALSEPLTSDEVQRLLPAFKLKKPRKKRA